jgi:hypothetical protein
MISRVIWAQQMLLTAAAFFLNMLVELSGQSASMSKQILRGFVRLSGLLRSWLQEAHAKGLLKANLDHQKIANFIIITLNGAAALYISSRDRSVLDQTLRQSATTSRAGGMRMAPGRGRGHLCWGPLI